ncbi:MAG: beta-propeller domain-containing protein [Acidimicrobiaceae bacterium]|nr:beta-propeller domain-containing protein [Acidimicrobiaceae bacterium]
MTSVSKLRRLKLTAQNPQLAATKNPRKSLSKLLLGLGLVLLIVATLLAAACSSEDSTDASSPDFSGGDSSNISNDDNKTQIDDDSTLTIDPDDDEIILTSRLVRFNECDDLLDHLRTEAAERVGPYGFEDGRRSLWGGRVMPMDFPDMVFEESMDMDDMMVDDMMAIDAATDTGVAGNRATNQQSLSSTSLVEGVDYSGTNVQEIGVDEADIIKTDGQRIFTISSNQLVVITADTREILGSVALPDSEYSELFLDGDSLLAIGTIPYFNDYKKIPEEPDVVPLQDDLMESGIELGTGHSFASGTVIHRVSLNENGTPEIMQTLLVRSSYVSARSTGGVARVIIRSQPQQDFPFVYPSGPNSEATAEAANKEAVLNSTLEDWLPAYSLTSQGDTAADEGILPPCGRIHAPTVFSGFGVTTVLSIPVAGPIDPSTSTAVLAPGDTVYASTESMYVATTAWIDPDGISLPEDSEDAIDPERHFDRLGTSIHRFDITDPTEATYTASGHVPGSIHNQFSLSEHAGHLRVVTTSRNSSGFIGFLETNSSEVVSGSESWVRVLQETSDGELVEVGSVGNIGKGEQVQSVRFVGDIGYVVTFRQIDPFYTIDLSDPTNPRIVGELKIPGFSSYLHPISDELILGVGSDADENGRVTGSKVSLFDVSNLASPQEIAVWKAPDSWNQIGWDHRAFLWWEPKSLAIIPVNVYAWQDNWAGAVVLRVEDSTLTEVGRITHKHAQSKPELGNNCRHLTEKDVIKSEKQDALIEEIASIARASISQEGWNSSSLALMEDILNIKDISESALTAALIVHQISGNDINGLLPATYLMDSWFVACDTEKPEKLQKLDGYHCEVMDTEYEPVLRENISIEDNESFWGCIEENYFYPREIIRNLVINNELWSLSYLHSYSNSQGVLQVNDLDTLDFLDSLNLDERSQ